jgi:flagellar hook capping protein FlgD
VTLRAILSPHWLRRTSLRGLFGPAIALLIATAPSPASATVLSIEPAPVQPTSCDSVAVVVKGELPGDCYTLSSATLEGPVLLPMLSAIPQYGLRVKILVLEPNLEIAPICAEIPVPYEQTLRLPFHPPGQYHAVATELVLPFFHFDTTTAVDSSRVEAAFAVAPDTCRTSCYLLDFRHPFTRIGPCDAGGAPGDTACVEISLGNREPVAGIQSAVLVFDPRVDPIPGVPVSGGVLRPVRVRAIGRADGFQVAWTADESTVKFMLYSDLGAALPVGDGPVLRVCYAIGHDTAPGPYYLRFGETVVASPTGTAIEPCPTFAEVIGRFCVGEPPCDLDGNGRSNVLDIIRLVRCALGGPDSTVCPDSVAVRADCNGDGTVDIRDVICCVRKMLAFGFGTLENPKAGTGTVGVAFRGPAEWVSATQGRAELDIDPGADFGGIELGIQAPPGTGITNVATPPGSAYHMGFDGSDPRTARVMLVRLGDAPSGPIRLQIEFQAIGGIASDAAIKVVRAESGSWSGAPAATEITNGVASVPAGAAGAPRVLPARPNPFTDATDIAYVLPAQRHVTLRVYSASGKLVRTLVDATVPQGIHRAPWNGRDGAGRVVGSGIYFVKLSTGDAESTIRVMRLR